MIVDSIAHLKDYSALLPNLKAGMDKIDSLKGEYQPGRWEFDGGFFFIQEGDTIPMTEGNFEAHRKYIDVQIIVKGSEEVAWKDLADTKEATPFSAEKDIGRYAGETSHSMLISEGMFYAVFPHDAHKPISHTAHRQHFVKIVMKLPA
ncbi:MAG: YhcH/YjgK/YiaL family protein [Succinivibrio sp.]|nr:YhcH/YjgK/YiaL family protein [Succinivibrio sp.]